MLCYGIRYFLCFGNSETFLNLVLSSIKFDYFIYFYEALHSLKGGKYVLTEACAGLCLCQGTQTSLCVVSLSSYSPRMLPSYHIVYFYTVTSALRFLKLQINVLLRSCNNLGSFACI